MSHLSSLHLCAVQRLLWQLARQTQKKGKRQEDSHNFLKTSSNKNEEVCFEIDPDRGDIFTSLGSVLRVFRGALHQVALMTFKVCMLKDG